jgi:leucyl aminopeptidase
MSYTDSTHPPPLVNHPVTSMPETFPIIERAPAKGKGSKPLPIHSFAAKSYDAWLKKQSSTTKNWLKANGYKASAGKCCLLPDAKGNLAGAAFCRDDNPSIWSFATLVGQLPPGTYQLDGTLTNSQATQAALGWALATYRFTKYKKQANDFPRLVAPKGCDMGYVKAFTTSIFWARDLINAPANDLTPDTLAREAIQFGRKFKGQVKVIKGEDLLKANYPMIYTVGKASSVPPHLVDIRFARKGAPKVTLVGKGVCFDTGGLDIKSTAGMKMMKKDMGGAACVLALARAIVETKLPVQLRVLLPIVENAVAGNAMRPLDIAPTRKGITVEIGNTDAEGRLILCDALTEADDEEPDLIIDCATLTGAARVALGTEVPAFFTPDDRLAHELMASSTHTDDPLWRLPLWKGYRSQLDTSHADLSNDPNSPYGGAITAALYLQEFVSKTPSWLHVDMMAWNLSGKPGRPQGGEAMAVRALYALIKERFT